MEPQTGAPNAALKVGDEIACPFCLKVTPITYLAQSKRVPGAIYIGTECGGWNADPDGRLVQERAPTSPRTAEDVVDDLRRISADLKVVPHYRDGTAGIIFPARAPREAQPVQLEGYVPKDQVADLLHYIADLLEQ